MTPCPNNDDLARLVDGALPPETAERIRAHLADCARCHEDEHVLRRIAADLRGAPTATVDVKAHVRAVMARLDRPLAPRSAGRRGVWSAAAAGLAAAACLLIVLGARRPARSMLGSTWQARGGVAPASLDRDVGVRPYGVRNAPREVAAGDALDRTTPLTAGFRNAGDAPVFLLLFAVDARHEVHWISPPFLRPGDDPASTPLAPTLELRLLATTAVLDDVPAGPLRIVSVVTSAPAHVSDVETLDESALGAAQIVARLPGAQVRETPVEVRP